MPMVDLVVSRGDREWRNRGLNSVPFAHTWEPVSRAAAGSLFLSAYVEEKVEGSKTDSMWGTLAEKVPVTDAFTGEKGPSNISRRMTKKCYAAKLFLQLVF